MYFLGLDASITNTGYALFEENRLLVTGAIPSKASSTADLLRFAVTADVLEDMLNKYGVPEGQLFYVMEDYSFGAKGQMTRIAENSAIIKYRLLTAFDCLPEVCSVQTLKKFAAGYKAGKGKGPVMVGCYKKWNFETNSDDVADAYVLAKIARELHYWIDHKEPRESLLKYEKECIETVRKRNKYTKK